jgi:ABC-type uncharacterized transport system permease subunit
LVAWRLSVKGTRPLDPALEPVQNRSVVSSGLSTTSLVLLAALITHAVALYLGVASEDGARVGFAHVLSAALWVSAGLLWLDGEHPHTGAMRALVLPVAAFIAPLPLVFPGALIGDIAARPLFVPHMMVGILTYAVLMLAVVHALVLAYAEQRLHGNSTTNAIGVTLIDRLPPLLTMERLLFRLLLTGFVLLTLTAVSGLFFSEVIFGRSWRLDHKTVFTLLAWAVFGALLLGRWVRGWRGRTATRLTIIGFVVMLLGYVGSRFVLEVILTRFAQ